MCSGPSSSSSSRSMRTGRRPRESCRARATMGPPFVGRRGAGVGPPLRGPVPAASIWGVPLYLLDQQGFRRVADTTFMVGFLFSDATDPEDIARYFRALK